MQSSTHLPLLVAVVAMAERLKSLPHPGKPPTKDVMQREGREKRRKKKKKNSKQHVGQCKTLKKKKNTNMFRLPGIFQVRKSVFIGLQHVSTYAAA